MARKLYDRSDVGCWADGTFGHDHVRGKLALLLRASEGPQDLADALATDMSDDASEEYDAIDWLNSNVCAADVRFDFIDGDLMLVRPMETCPDCGMESEGGSEHSQGCPALV